MNDGTNFIRKAYTLLFLTAFLMHAQAQRSIACDSLFFTDGNKIGIELIKMGETSLQYRLCGEKYGWSYEATLAGVQKIKYRNGLEQGQFDVPGAGTGVSITPIPQQYDTAQVWRIEMYSGNDFYGKIRRSEPQGLTLQSPELGEVHIPFVSIKKMERMGKQHTPSNPYWFENPHATRYFFGTNGFGLHKGEGYYTNTWVLYNQVSYGFTDQFTMGVGTIPLFLFGADIVPFWVTPKVSIPLGHEKWNGAAGVLYMNIINSGADNFSGLGVAYGTVTYGTTDKNATLSFGYGFYDGDWANTPTVSFSAMHRLNRNNYFVTENYLLPGGDGRVLLLSAGGRWVGRRIAIDYALVRPFGGGLGESGFFAFPWLGFTAPFGSWRE